MKVTIYSTPTCPYCNMLKEWLDENKITYENFDVSSDQAKAKEMTDKTGQMGVPVSVVVTDDGKEEVVIGFDKDKLGPILGIK